MISHSDLELKLTRSPSFAKEFKQEVNHRYASSDLKGEYISRPFLGALVFDEIDDGSENKPLPDTFPTSPDISKLSEGHDQPISKQFKMDNSLVPIMNVSSLANSSPNPKQYDLVLTEPPRYLNQKSIKLDPPLPETPRVKRLGPGDEALFPVSPLSPQFTHLKPEDEIERAIFDMSSRPRRAGSLPLAPTQNTLNKLNEINEQDPAFVRSLDIKQAETISPSYRMTDFEPDIPTWNPEIIGGTKKPYFSFIDRLRGKAKK
jgi:hypothetical protein